VCVDIHRGGHSTPRCASNLRSASRIGSRARSELVALVVRLVGRPLSGREPCKSLLFSSNEEDPLCSSSLVELVGCCAHYGAHWAFLSP
jgi:hypothetical protein